jgi:hypothetical protein
MHECIYAVLLLDLNQIHTCTYIHTYIHTVHTCTVEQGSRPAAAGRLFAQQNNETFRRYVQISVNYPGYSVDVEYIPVRTRLVYIHTLYNHVLIPVQEYQQHRNLH